ncbi:hypothetical protein E2562_008366 [Oryza meyeriana var. granulata]|uniref:Uncharacterized protein n=1 Tax=Oryza meyeriana var. granulata TaxID=110450 RepID=A0A6G1EH29_9ORYZ|nr:hypothetical protein E2562_008366 [Oryza meyeriana var. granulata]
MVEAQGQRRHPRAAPFLVDGEANRSQPRCTGGVPQWPSCRRLRWQPVLFSAPPDRRLSPLIWPTAAVTSGSRV